MWLIKFVDLQILIFVIMVAVELVQTVQITLPIGVMLSRGNMVYFLKGEK
jgi:hypothetical protein